MPNKTTDSSLVKLNKENLKEFLEEKTGFKLKNLTPTHFEGDIKELNGLCLDFEVDCGKYKLLHVRIITPDLIRVWGYKKGFVDMSYQLKKGDY